MPKKHFPQTSHALRYKAFLQAIRKARLDAGRTQAEVARRLGKPQSYISKAETGERRLDFLELEELARLYGVDLKDFSTLGKTKKR